jgi:hypothetical protein
VVAGTVWPLGYLSRNRRRGTLLAGSGAMGGFFTASMSWMSVLV